MKTMRMKRQAIICFWLMAFLLFTLLTLNVSAVSDTLPEAVNGVITLTEDVTLTAGYVVESGKTLTINLAGYTLRTTTGLKADTITVEKGATLKITGDGTITNSYNADNYAALFNNGTVIIDGADFTLDTTVNKNTYYVIVNHGTMETSNVNVTSNDSGSSLFENGYSNYTSGNQRSGYVEGINAVAPKLTIHSGIYDGGMNTIKNDDGAEVIIEDGTFRNTVQVSLMNWNIATINGGTFETPTGNDKTNIFVGNYGADSVDKGILVINGGTFEAEHLLEGYTGVVTPVEINGGTFNYTKSFLNEEPGKIHNSLIEESGVDIVGEVTAPVSALKYAKSGAVVTLNTDVSIGDEIEVPEGVKVVLTNSDDDKEVVKNEDGTYTVQYKDADYSKVDELIKKVESLNKEDYKDFSEVEAAVKAVVYGKNITEQETVNNYAKAIETAIANLEKKETTNETTDEVVDDEEIENPQTSDNILTSVAIGIVGLVTIVGIVIYKKQK